MNKEEKQLRESLKGFGCSQRVEYILDEFFTSNVVIPKGEKRHQNADVLHEWVEDTSKTLESLEYSHDNGKYYWADCDIKYAVRTITTEIRIKPYEPVYEWQWKYKNADTGLWTYSPYMTDTEFDCFCYSSSNIATKDEETKRERKQ